MENTKTALELAQSWKKLSFELTRKRTMDLKLFEETFSGTYAFLLESIQEPAIEKTSLPLLINAFFFTNTSCNDMSSQHRAALILTERMLNCCVMDGAKEAVEGTDVYILEIHGEVYISFKNVTESLDALANLL